MTLISHYSKKQPNKKFNIDVESLLFIPNKVCIYWKDLNGIYEGCNDFMAEMISLPSRQTCVGLTDYDYGCLIEEAASYCQEDRKVITTGISRHYSSQITIHNRRIILSTFKLPLKNHNGKIIGVLGFSHHLNEFQIEKTFHTLAKAKVSTKTIKHLTTQQNNQTTNFGLSAQQIECLYWLVKGLTTKQTAKIMELSPRTVETYLNIVKIKLNCSSRRDLIEKALSINLIKNRLF